MKAEFGFAAVSAALNDLGPKPRRSDVREGTVLLAGWAENVTIVDVFDQPSRRAGADRQQIVPLASARSMARPCGRSTASELAIGPASLERPAQNVNDRYILSPPRGQGHGLVYM